jgi:hypothetical protein
LLKFEKSGNSEYPKFELRLSILREGSCCSLPWSLGRRIKAEVLFLKLFLCECEIRVNTRSNSKIVRVLPKLTNFYSLGYVKRPLNCNSTAQASLSEVGSRADIQRYIACKFSKQRQVL